MVVVTSSDDGTVGSEEALLVVQNKVTAEKKYPQEHSDSAASTIAKAAAAKERSKPAPPTSESSCQPLSPQQLKVVLCNGNQMYSHTISLVNIKLTPMEDKAKLSDYFLQDGREHPNILISFQKESSFTIKVAVKQRVMAASTGLMKFVYSGSLVEDSTISMLKFCNSMLGKPLNEAKSQITKLQSQLEKFQKATKDWKDTATKLDQHVWQNEKDRLLDGFLKLWNEYKSNAQSEIARLKDELEKAKKATQKKSTARELFDAPDDLDEDGKEPIPRDVAEALADGRPTNGISGGRAIRKPKRTPILGPEDQLNMSKLKEQQEAYKQRKAEAREETKKKKRQQEQQEEKKMAAVEDSESSSQEMTIRPAKKKARKKNSIGSPNLETSIDEYSEDEAMRKAIRANVARAKSGGDDSDASF